MMARLKELWREEKSSILFMVSLYLVLSGLMSVIACVVPLANNVNMTLGYICIQLITSFAFVGLLFVLSALLLLLIYVVHMGLSKLFS